MGCTSPVMRKMSGIFIIKIKLGAMKYSKSQAYPSLCTNGGKKKGGGAITNYRYLYKRVICCLADTFLSPVHLYTLPASTVLDTEKM